MASKRQLKKRITRVLSGIYDQAFLLSLFAEGELLEQFNALMDDIMVFTDDTLRRVQHPDGKDNPKLVRRHYRELRSDLHERSTAFDDRVVQLLEQL